MVATARHAAIPNITDKSIGSMFRHLSVAYPVESLWKKCVPEDYVPSSVRYNVLHMFQPVKRHLLLARLMTAAGV